jgi:hypothetical protein
MFSQVKAFFAKHTMLAFALVLVTGFGLAFIPVALLQSAKSGAINTAHHPMFPVVLIAAFAGALVVFIVGFHKNITAEFKKVARDADLAFWKAHNITVNLTDAEVIALKQVVKNGGAFTEAEFTYLNNQAVVAITTNPAPVPAVPAA